MQKNIRVLIADDHIHEREGYSQLLTTIAGLEIVGKAASALEAVRMALDLRPDIILMDLVWFKDPTAGISAIAAIKAEAPEIKVLVMTVYPELIVDARGAGADVAVDKGSVSDVPTLARLIQDTYRAPGPTRQISRVPHTASSPVPQRLALDSSRTLLDRFDTSERPWVSAMLAPLNGAEITELEWIMSAVEARQIPPEALQRTFGPVWQALVEVHQQDRVLTQPSVPDHVHRVAELVNAPTVDVMHKVKITIPLVPFLMSYEGEVDLKSGLNLESLWNWLISTLRSA